MYHKEKATKEIGKKKKNVEQRNTSQVVPRALAHHLQTPAWLQPGGYKMTAGVW